MPRTTRRSVRAAGSKPYNILPTHDLHAEFPEVRAASAALHAVDGLRPPPRSRSRPRPRWGADKDLMDWLGAFFGFQRDNVRNQREHLLLLLANAQMRLPSSGSGGSGDTLDPRVARSLGRKLLRNYTSWCGFLGRRPNVPVADAGTRADLLFTGLYLLVWGEAANLRFLPECLCYIYHHMALELRRILEGDEGRPANPAAHGDGENAFLDRVVAPIYGVIRAGVESSRNGTAAHADWRNYDELNEYFWRRDVFDRLGWPMDRSQGFFRAPPEGSRVRKTGFVEVRSFWNIYRSFDRLWVMLLLYLQAAVIVAWDGATATWPWQSLRSHRGVQVHALTIFITWAGLCFLQTLLEIGTQFRRALRDRDGGRMLAARMVFKAIVAAGWVLTFSLLYNGIWSQRDSDQSWWPGTDARILRFLYAAAVFVLPAALAMVLLVFPCLPKALEKTNWRVCHAITWWFHSRVYVGRGLRESTFDSVRYSAFWILVLAVKFSFSYFLQIRPLVAPTKEIYGLSTAAYASWHELFRHGNPFAVLLLWFPVVLIYLMDIQIWYVIFSSLAGAWMGLFLHLGEIRDMEQLRLRFQFFASAMSFNIMPEQQHDNGPNSILRKLRNCCHRLRLRYGLFQGRSFSRISLESNKVEERRFALVWNEIIAKFREEDIVNDREVELLALLPAQPNVRVVRWPCFLLFNQLSRALAQAKEFQGSDRSLWSKICKNDYGRCAVCKGGDSG